MSQNLLFDFADFVRITNLLPEAIEGRYDGRDYVWDAHEEGKDPFYLDVNKIVATHIFGWLDPEKTYLAKDAQEIRERAMLRLGWVQPIHNPNAPQGHPLKAGFAKLQKVMIGPLPPFQNVRLLRPTDAEGKEDPNRAPIIDLIEPSAAGGSGNAGGEGGGTAAPPDPPVPNFYPRVQQNIKKPK